ncbi:putative zinc finger protein 66 [Sabethes cyaneus]|uniref:putative zinc finger protein 66 n=1 Tax=Sabethes cyaneus TaxID=53552 RepID=UPI00237EC0C8|nr:putative zinc finger protein 66 [Sabethes cyaneus]
MVATGLKSCFTCCRRTENFLCITEDDNLGEENLEEIFVKHFWFSKDEYRNGVLCSSCWAKIDEFHKFYCEVEKLHASNQLETELKSEPNDENPDGNESLLFAEAILKIEDQDSLYVAVEKLEPSLTNVNENSDSENVSVPQQEDNLDADEDCPEPPEKKLTESESELDSNVPLAKRRIATASVRKKCTPLRSPASTLRNEKFICHPCVRAGTNSDRTYRTFYWLKQHFNKQHNKTRCYIFCCERQFFTTRGYNRHASIEHDKTRTKKRRCVECARWFKEESTFQSHMFLVHTPEEAKKFQCTHCTKTFLLEDQRNSHVKWHEEVEQRNHYCSPCDRYFAVAGNLERHIEQHHTNEPSASGGQTSKEKNATGDQNEGTDGEEDDDSDSEKPTAAPTEYWLNEPVKIRRPPEVIEEQEELIRQFIVYNCSRCEYIGKSFCDLKGHTARKHYTSGSIVICCERSFTSRQILYEHCLRHRNPDQFKCHKCDKNFTDSRGLRHHNWWIHTPVSKRPFKCDVCGDAFIKDYSLKAHMQKHIEKERRVNSCDQCTRVYTTPKELKRHQQREHGAFAKWVCDVCAMGFSHRKLLEQHHLTHSMEGLLKLRKQCEKCQRWLSNEKSYKRHKVRCNAEPARCQLCDHVSTSQATLKSHTLRMHSNVRKYACTYCGKEFKKKLRCKEHEANHTGVVLYKCEYCPRSCNSSSNMYTHKKTAHPEEWAAAVAAKLFTPI